MTRPAPSHDVGTSTAVLLPCRNEAATIAKVVADFRRVLPKAAIYVYDNASSDATSEVATSAGAIVRSTPEKGKGNVLRRMFADIEADVYVLADGDDTYDADAAPALVRHLAGCGLDMVVATREQSPAEAHAFPRGHRVGNRLLSHSVHWCLGQGSADMLSGYRVLSRRYVKSFPALSRGFEVETEMTVHALELRLPFDELGTAYRSRIAGSTSNLRTVRDGVRIAHFIIRLWRDCRPLRFFGSISFLALLTALVVGARAIGHLHSWTPATFTVEGCTLVAAVAFLAGVVADSIGRRQRELKRMLFLALPPPNPTSDFPVQRSGDGAQR